MESAAARDRHFPRFSRATEHVPRRDLNSADVGKHGITITIQAYDFYRMASTGAAKAAGRNLGIGLAPGRSPLHAHRASVYKEQNSLFVTVTASSKMFV